MENKSKEFATRERAPERAPVFICVQAGLFTPGMPASLSDTDSDRTFFGSVFEKEEYL